MWHVDSDSVFVVVWVFCAHFTYSVNARRNNLLENKGTPAADLISNLGAQAGMENLSKACVYRAKDMVTGHDDKDYAVTPIFLPR